MILIKLIFKTINLISYFYSKWEKKYYKLRIKETCISYMEPLNVNAQKSFVTHKTKLGKNVNFNGMKMYGEGKIVIVNNFHSGKNCSILTSFHNYESTSIPYDTTYIHKNVIIEDNVWLGEAVMILGGVTIGEGVIIQAGSVVVNNIPKYSIAGGHPAKVFKKRNLNRYLKLKIEGKFH